MPQLDLWQPTRMAVGYSAEHVRGLAEGQDSGEQLRDTHWKHASNNGRDPARRDCGPRQSRREVRFHGDAHRGARR